MRLSLEDEELIYRARQVRENAYAPYSMYKVGAAIRDSAGRIHVGVNVENVSYGACICAERSAISAMVSAGANEIVAIAVVTKDGGFPCGICLQCLSEFTASDLPVNVILDSNEFAPRIYEMRELFPAAFSTNLLRQAGS